MKSQHCDSIGSEVSQYMSAYEQILEAVTFSKEEETSWWKYFDTRGEAREALREAIKYSPEEYEIISLVDAMDKEFPSGQSDSKLVYIDCLKELRKKLKNG
jgi:hypothetical protein